MIANQLKLTSKQVNFFDGFLADGTARILHALKTIFELDIDSSDSCIEIASADQSENLKHLGNEPLYTISSTMMGDVQGSILILLRSDDFKYLSKIMAPTLSLIFLSRPGDDLTELDNQKPDWMKGNGARLTDDADYLAQMMDTLTELANILIGLYGRAIYQVSELNTQYSVPKVLKHPNQQALKQVLSSSERSDQLHLVIQNDFFVMDKSIKLWCLISPTRKSFQKILKRAEYHKEDTDNSSENAINEQIVVPFFASDASAKRPNQA